MSLKVRTGWDAGSLNADQAAAMAHEEGFVWMAIHGRSREQGYSGQADWGYIQWVKSKARLPIIGNGDLDSGQKAARALRLSKCDGAMIGRGCLGSPWIFKEALEELKNFSGGFREETAAAAAAGAAAGSEKAKSQAAGPRAPLENQRENQRDILSAMSRLRSHLEGFYDERLFLLQMKKFASWLSAGAPHSAPFRQRLFQEKDKAAALQMIEEFFARRQSGKKERQPYEPFLMRGHG